VLTLEGSHVSTMTRFLDNGVLPHFGLPRTLRG
jgi:RNA polymerase sigma-70 factor (ECF subfamily)